jgi:SAM-dependent methyltransferase
MKIDIREKAARYYDLFAPEYDDLPFYRQRTSSSMRMLELGCGTGRVLVPLAARCASIHGLDGSAAMLDRCRAKIQAARLTNANITLADITDFDLENRFDLIIAPFRVMQNLDSDEQIAGLFACISQHLAERGTCILNVFNPRYDRATMLWHWQRPYEDPGDQAVMPDGTVVRHCEYRKRIQADPLVIYPELIFRAYRDGELIDTTVLPIAMRCWYPDEFRALIQDAGFRIVNAWGGYDGERYNEGSELIVEFAQRG